MTRTPDVERAYRAYEHLQADDIEGFLEFVDPDAEWHSLVLEIEGAFRGHDGVRAWWQGLLDAFPDWKPTLVDIQDLGGVLVILGRGTGIGAGSGVGIDDEFWQVTQMRDGKITRYRAARTEAEAMAIAESWREPPRGDAR